ncbi:hypothetical protein BDN72DRAFT_391301 [Pluteus cervinus]|uniref:Uncharacterized protein n=1 Tax=Pluteus cervinus TaxID=181527 RepID=A0ACD3AAA9_9AGAR|nr:hypothetical protein BDN72DRAFT_391301 [Pluteus cervinus]
MTTVQVQQINSNEYEPRAQKIHIVTVRILLQFSRPQRRPPFLKPHPPLPNTNPHIQTVLLLLRKWILPTSPALFVHPLPLIVPLPPSSSLQLATSTPNRHPHHRSHHAHHASHPHMRWRG